MIKPLGKRTLIKLPPAEDTTEAGIVLVKAERPKGEGVVVETGSDLVKVGDNVLYCTYGPMEFRQNKIDYVVADEMHLVAIVTD